MSKQTQLLDAVADINESIGDDVRYLQSEISVETLTITLLWNHPDAAIRAKLEPTLPAGISLALEDYPYSTRDMDKAVAAVWRNAAKWEDDYGFTVNRIEGIDKATKSIKVLGLSTAPGTARVASDSVKRQVDEAVRNATAGGVSAEVTVIPEDAAALPAGRQNDTSPFYPGAYFINSDSGLCSSGFGVVYQGANRSTTARHCDNPSYRPRDVLNYSYNGVTKVDGGTGVKIVTSSGGSKAFVGSFSPTTSKPVTKVVDVSLNAYVCTSGGNSGEHCNVKITAMKVSWSDTYGSFYNIEGTQTVSSSIAVARGDSGGPVMTYVTSDSIGAVGIIQYLGARRSTCPTMRDATPCSMVVGFSSIHSMFSNTGARLRTG